MHLKRIIPSALLKQSFRQIKNYNYVSAHMRSLGTFNNDLFLLILLKKLLLLAGEVENQLYVV